MRSIKIYNEAAAIWGQVNPIDDTAVEDFYVNLFPELSHDTQGEILDFILSNDSYTKLDQTAQQALRSDFGVTIKKTYRRFQSFDPDRRTHELKTWPAAFEAVWSDHKHYELRDNDRNFLVGDNILLREYILDTDEYTGREIEAEISYMTYGGEWGLAAELCILSFHIITTTEP